MTDLKPEEPTSPEVDQPENKPESLDLQAQLAELEAQLSKEVEEKENYKKGVLSKEEENKRLKAALKAFEGTPEEPIEPKEPEEPKAQDEPKEPEEPKTPEKPEVAPQGYNPEKEAIAQFKRENPGVNMEEVLANYRGGKFDTVTEIKDALQDAKDYVDFKSNKKPNSGYSASGGGVSEVETKTTSKVTAKDVEMAKRYFGGDLQRYLKNK